MACCSRTATPYRGIGVNYFDAFARTLTDHNDTSYDAGFRVLAEHRIPFARFMCTGFWPAEMKLYREDKQAYFKLLDGVVLSAQKHGIGLIPEPVLVHADGARSRGRAVRSVGQSRTARRTSSCEPTRGRS